MKDSECLKDYFSKNVELLNQIGEKYLIVRIVEKFWYVCQKSMTIS